jgi:uncharacterized membrane protein YidH (DUF202 family)
MRTTLGATAFAVAAKAFERFFATSGDSVRGVTAAAVAGAGAGGAAAAICRDSPAFAAGVSPFCSHEPNKPAMPITAMMACLRSLMIVVLCAVWFVGLSFRASRG